MVRTIPNSRDVEGFVARARSAHLSQDSAKLRKSFSLTQALTLAFC
jgi:hypothetical protein